MTSKEVQLGQSLLNDAYSNEMKRIALGKRRSRQVSYSFQEKATEASPPNLIHPSPTCYRVSLLYRAFVELHLIVLLY